MRFPGAELEIGDRLARVVSTNQVDQNIEPVMLAG